MTAGTPVSCGGGARTLRDKKASIRSCGRCRNSGVAAECGSQRGGKAIDIAPRTVRLVAQHLGCHVLGCEHDLIGGRHRLANQQPGDPEVSQLDPTVSGQQHVARLDVAMQYAELVRSHQRIGHGHPYRGDVPGIDGTSLGDNVGERPTIEVLSHQIRLADGRPAGGVHGDDVRMSRKAGDRVGLPPEIRQTLGSSTFAAQHLDGNLTIERLPSRQ